MQRSVVFLFALTGTLGYAAIQRAGIDPVSWNSCLLALGLIVGSYWLGTPNSVDCGRFDRVTAACISIILVLIAAQRVPIPTGIVHVLSPHRVEISAAVGRLASANTDFTTLTAVPYETIQYLLTLSAYALVILFVWRLSLSWRESPWTTVWPLLIVSGLEAALGCYQASVGAAVEGARGTYLNRDHFAGLLEMALPFALIYPIAVLNKGRHEYSLAIRPAVQACIGVAFFVVLLSAIMLSLSRGAFLASLGSTLVVLFALFLVRGRDSTVLRNRSWVRWTGLVLALLLIIAGFLWLPTDSFIARFADLPSSEGVSSEMRVQIWRETTKLIRDYLLLGCGAGSYGSCFLMYKQVAPMQTVDYAHNDYLQVLSEFGTIGFAAGAVLMGRIIQLTIRAARRGTSADQRYVAIACLGAMVAILLHSLVDFNMYVPANGLAFAWVLGTALACGSRATKGESMLAPNKKHMRRDIVLAGV